MPPKKAPSEAELENAKAQVINRKVALTTARQILEAELAKDVPAVTEIEEALEVVREVTSQLEKYAQKYSHLLTAAGNSEEFQNEDRQMMEISIANRKSEAQVKRIIQKRDDNDGNGNSSGVRRGDSSSRRASFGDSSGQRRKLPKLNLPRFAGDVRQWLPFWSQFKEIDADDNIATTDKFQYLLQSMVENSEAYKIISSYPLCEDNYAMALKNLKDRYGRQDLLVKVYVRDLLNLAIDNASNKTHNFCELYTKLSAQIRALGSLGVTTNACASIIYPVVESCLPMETLRAWQRDGGFKEAKGSVEELEKLMEFLDKEVKGEDNIRLACGGIGHAHSEVGTKTSEYKKKSSSIPTAASLISTDGTDRKKCLFCGQNHPTARCGKAESLSLETKNQILREKRACFNCLNIGHSKKMCKTFVKCFNCGKRHSTVMCGQLKNHQKQSGSEKEGGKPQQQSETVKSEEPKSDTSLVANQLRSPDVLLMTLILKVHGYNGCTEARALVDSGSTKSYIVKSLANHIGLMAVGEESVIHGLFGGQQTSMQKHKRYKILISDLKEKYMCDFLISDVEKITGRINSVPDGPWIEELRRRNICITDIARSDQPVDILLGADVLGKLLTGKKIELSSGPVAVETKLGWTMMGKMVGLSTHGSVEYATSSVNIEDACYENTLHVNADIPKLWEMDVIGIKDSYEKQTTDVTNNAILQDFTKTLSKNKEGRYEVELPWITGHNVLPTNRWIAERRLKTTTDRLVRDGTLSKYNDLFNQWEAEGMIEEVPMTDDQTGHYLPHRAVYKPESTTTPIRPVFDASCRTKNQPSLNNCLECGPNLLEEIPVILTRFRLGKVGVISDIRKAFQQISVGEKDRDVMRFLWWKDASCTGLKIYRHCRVVFGVNSSPFILAATLRHLLETSKTKYKSTAGILEKSLYVDNVVAAVPTFEEAEVFKKEANEIMSTAKFELRGWEIGPVAEEKSTPLLGLVWNMKADTLECDVSRVKYNPLEQVTKRKMLAVAHSIFDPVGFTCPFTLIPKMLLQEAWSLKTGWDSELPKECSDKFLKWVNQIPLLCELKIPRCIISLSSDKKNWSLHVFVDASKHAYAACVFLRIEVHGQVAVQLVLAKSRVSPLKPMTIPRLELTSCVIGARLADVGKKILEYEDINATYWSDSTTAVHWITQHGNWGVFVQRRVEEIRRLTVNSTWRHIPGEMNPADVPSRGASAAQIIHSRWWEGPDWLYKNEDQWPKSMEQEQPTCEVLKEVKKTVVSALNCDDILSRICKLNTYAEMLRNVSYEIGCKDQEPTPKLLRAAEKQLLKLVQEAAFTGVDDKRLKRFQTYKDEDGLIRMKTRMDYGDFEDSFKFPVVLPQESPVVKAKIMEEHMLNSHAGVNQLLSMMRKKFWILNGRRTIRNTLRACLECQRYNARKMKCQEAALPKERVQAEVPFEITGIDFAGPLYLKSGRKVWICLFTCAVYRALRRFIGRRGRPRVIYSDNGTNLVGCYNSFKINWRIVQSTSLCRPIIWRFNPPTAAWWGGWWERIIGVVKQSLRKVIGKDVLAYEELQTILVDVESMVNQRPLTYISEDPNDPAPLTPYMFLIGNQESNLVEADVLDSKTLKKKLRRIQTLRDDLKQRFKQEYLGQLISSSPKREKRIVKVGDVVIVEFDNQKRIDWPIGTIVKTFPGKDGVVRLVKVKTSGGELLRPIQRIYPFEVPEEAKQENQPRSGRNIKIPEGLTLLDVDVFDHFQG